MKNIIGRLRSQMGIKLSLQWPYNQDIWPLQLLPCLAFIWIGCLCWSIRTVPSVLPAAAGEEWLHQKPASLQSTTKCYTCVCYMYLYHMLQNTAMKAKKAIHFVVICYRSPRKLIQWLKNIIFCKSMGWKSCLAICSWRLSWGYSQTGWGCTDLNFDRARLQDGSLTWLIINALYCLRSLLQLQTGASQHSFSLSQHGS